jgi:hypothetical protein
MLEISWVGKLPLCSARELPSMELLYFNVSKCFKNNSFFERKISVLIILLNVQEQTIEKHIFISQNQ